MPIVEESKEIRYTEEGTPILTPKVTSTVTNLKTGHEYNSEDEVDADVADPNTETTVDDIRRDVVLEITEGFSVFGESDES